MNGMVSLSPAAVRSLRLKLPSWCPEKEIQGGGGHGLTGSCRIRPSLGPLDHSSFNPMKCKKKTQACVQENHAKKKITTCTRFQADVLE